MMAKKEEVEERDKIEASGDHGKDVEILSYDEAREKVAESAMRHKDVTLGDLRLAATEKGIIWKGTKDKDLKEPKLIQNWTTLGRFQKQTGISMGSIKEYIGDPDLVERMIAFSQNKRADERLRMVWSQDEVIEVTDTTKPYIDPLEFFDIVGEEVKDVKGATRVEIGGNGMEVDFITGRTAAPARKRGDVSHSGVSIHWNGGIAVEPFVFRLVCVNGLTRRVGVTREADTIDTFKSLLRSAFKMEVDNADNLLKAFAKSAETELKNPTTAVLAEARNHDLSDHTARILAERTAAMEGNTVYDMVNLFTSYANEQPAQRAKLWRAGGGIIRDYEAHDSCGKCGHLLGTVDN